MRVWVTFSVTFLLVSCSPMPATPSAPGGDVVVIFSPPPEMATALLERAAVGSTQVAWQATYAVQRTQTVALREDQVWYEFQARKDSMLGLAGWLLLAALLLSVSIFTWAEVGAFRGFVGIIQAAVSRRMVEAQLMRIRDLAMGTVYVPPVGIPFLLSEPPAPIVKAEIGFIDSERWRQTILAFAWCGQSLGSFSELSYTKNQITTHPAWRSLSRWLVQAGVWERRRGQGEKNDTWWSPEWDYDKLRAALESNNFSLPYPAGNPPEIHQEALANASYRPTSRDVEPEPGG